MSLFLGLDASTQSLTAVLIDVDARAVVAERQVQFEQDLPEYGTQNGVLEHPDPRVKHSDPRMWVAALDHLLSGMQDDGLPMAAIRGISGAGQQHGSVYLARPLPGWRLGEPLARQLGPLLSRATAPIWMDSSTLEDCRAITRAVGDATVRKVTGSPATPRFTGPQIRKFARTEPQAWGVTVQVHLVSSFMASVLVGKDVPIDLADGAGMNLVDLQSGTFAPVLLDATAPALGERLLPPVASTTRVGAVHPYFVTRYGFNVGTPVIAFTGDNPSSLVGIGATAPGCAAISLGTSDTYFAAMSEPHVDPAGLGHVFGNPAGGFMSLICFSNGSLARQAVAERGGMDWNAFSQGIQATPPGNDGRYMLPYFIPEVTPLIAHPWVRLHGDAAFEQWRRPQAAARAVVEAQAVAMRHHTRWIPDTADRILVTGGGSVNRAILQVWADVFGVPMQSLEQTHSAALGGALRAAHATSGTPWAELYDAFCRPAKAVHPTPGVTEAYTDLLHWRNANLPNELLVEPS